MSLPETFDIHYHYYYNCYCAYCTSFSIDIRFQVIWKKVIKGSQKRRKNIYLYKSVDIYIFFITFKIYQNFKTYHAGKLNKTDLVNIRFAHQGLFPET